MITTETPLTRWPAQRPIERAVRMFLALKVPWGPGFAEVATSVVPATDCPVVHLEQAMQARHPMAYVTSLEPSLAFAWQQYLRTSDIVRWRQDIVEDPRLLVEEFEETTVIWCSQLPQHLKTVYTDAQTGQPLVQFPALIHILRLLDYPDVDTIQHELQIGFRMLGHLTPGAGWKRRTDDFYANPVSIDAFLTSNDVYIQKCA